MTVQSSNVIDIRALQAVASQQRNEVRALNFGGGGGTFDGMEARFAKLESSIGYIEREITDLKSEVRSLRSDARVDFRILFGAIITVSVGLAGLMAKGFHWL